MLKKFSVKNTKNCVKNSNKLCLKYKKSTLKNLVLKNFSVKNTKNLR